MKLLFIAALLMFSIRSYSQSIFIKQKEETIDAFLKDTHIEHEVNTRCDAKSIKEFLKNRKPKK